MKKVLVLACLLALVAVLAVPMAASAASTTVGGTVKYATITVVAPKAMTWSTFAIGWNTAVDNTTTTRGSVTVVAGTSGTVSAEVTAKSAAGKHWLYKDATNHLDEYFIISLVDSSPAWAEYHLVSGDGGAVQGHTFSGPATKAVSTPGVWAPGTSKTMYYNFWAAQYITANDAASHAGTYSATVEFTGTCIP